MSQIDATALARARYNRAAPFYDIIDAFTDGAFKAGRSKIWSQTLGVVLEVGVGTGRNFPYYPPNCQVIAIDFAERMLERAHIRASALGTNVVLRQGDVEHLDFMDNMFDTAVTTCVFCSVPDPIQGLRELNRVVKADGKIPMLEHERINHPVLGRIMDWMNPLFVRMWGANMNRRTVENVKRAGLQITSVEKMDPMNMVKFIIARPNKTALA